MKRIPTVIKDMKHEVKQELKKLASNSGLSGFKSMDNEELEALLLKNIDGFLIEDDPIVAEVTISWLYENKRVGVMLSVDFPEGEILKDYF